MRVLASVLGLAVCTLAGAAERDICVGKSGIELIRCIEAAARESSSAPATGDQKPASAQKSRGAVPAQRDPAPRAQDCTGLAEAEMRRCLAAGGQLAPSAAVLAPTSTPTAIARPENCEGESGEKLRQCIEAGARAQKAKAQKQQTRVLACDRYASADQALCAHRNDTLVECRKAGKYPDFDICVRSYMSRAPEPKTADCSRMQARVRAHCERRNRVFQSCLGDKLGYFACLEHQLGADALLTKR
jgi:hypothetical protein